MNELTCPTCSSKFLPFRIDQEFCSTNCRVRYNNRKAKERRDQWKDTIQILYTNHIILDEMLGSLNERIVTSNALLAKGYKINYITHFEQIGDDRKRIVLDIIVDPINTSQLKLKRL